MPNQSSESFPPDKPIRVGAGSMRGNVLSEDQKAVLVDMAAKQEAGDESDIDYSDIPPPTDSQLARAIRGKILFGGSGFPGTW